MCWNSGVRERLKLCSMRKMRRKSGLRRAQRMYQGRAVMQKAAIAAGWRRRRASRQRLVKSAQRKTAPPQRIMAGGPLARTARARKRPKRREVKEVEEVKEIKDDGAVAGASVGLAAVASLGKSGGEPPHSKGSLSRTAAQTMAMVSMALKGMSVAAAWEKPIMPTVVGRRSRSQRAVSWP